MNALHTSCHDTCCSATASSTSEPRAIQQPDFHRLSASLANSEIHPEELQMLHTVGHGSSGSVSQVLHIPSASVLALKSIPVDTDEASRKAILLELKALHECTHSAIVSFYGAFFREGTECFSLNPFELNFKEALGLIRGAQAQYTLRSSIWTRPCSTSCALRQPRYRSMLSRQLRHRCLMGLSTCTERSTLSTETSSHRTFCSTRRPKSR